MCHFFLAAFNNFSLSLVFRWEKKSKSFICPWLTQEWKVAFVTIRQGWEFSHPTRPSLMPCWLKRGASLLLPILIPLTQGGKEVASLPLSVRESSDSPLSPLLHHASGAEKGHLLTIQWEKKSWLCLWSTDTARAGRGEVGRSVHYCLAGMEIPDPYLAFSDTTHVGVLGCLITVSWG